MSFQPLVSACHSQPSFDLSSMLSKASEYADGEKALYEYIKGILNNPVFQKDPKTFLQKEFRRTSRSEVMSTAVFAQGFFTANFET